MPSQKKLNKLTFSECVGLIALGVIIVIMPLIVRLYGHETTAEEALVYRLEFLFESFTYYKSLVLSGFFWVVLIVYVFDVLVGDKKITLQTFKDPVTTAALVYMLCVMLSTVFSPYKETSLRGISERSEGVFALLAYMAAFLCARVLAEKSVKHIRILFGFFLCSAGLIGIIGAFQTFGLDIFKTDFILRLVMHEYYGIARLDNLYTKAYATLHNPNSLGLFAAFFAPVFCFTAVYAPKKEPYKYISAFVFVTMLICLYGAESVAGYIGLAAGLLIAFVVIAAKLYKKTANKKKFRVAAGGATLLILLIGGLSFERVSSLIIYHFNIDGGKYPQRFDALTTTGNTAVISGSEIEVAVVSGADGAFYIKDHEPTAETAGEGYTELSYSIPGWGRVTLRYADNACFVNARSGEQFLFAVLDSNITLLSSKQKPVDLTAQVPSFGFKGMENFATGRGFIWSRSVPLLKDNLLIGKGPDSFAYQFPQDDLAGNLKAFGSPYSIVDKPHNMYLQIGINTGLVSLIAVLVIFAVYLKLALTSVIKNNYQDGFLYGLSFGLFTGVFAYLVCTLSTDSSVCTSPLFYAALGLGFGIVTLTNGRRQ